MQSDVFLLFFLLKKRTIYHMISFLFIYLILFYLLREKYPRGVRVGEVAKGEKGRLACKEIYHVVLAKFTDEYKDQCIQVR